MKPRLRSAAIGLMLCVGISALARNASAATLVFPGSAALLATQEAENHSERELILDLVNFILLLAALGYILRKPAKTFFAQRTASTRGKLEEGAKSLEAARAKLAEVEAKLSGLDQEIAELKAASERDMEAELRRIRHETSEELVKIQQFTQAQIFALLRIAKSDLKRFAAREAVEQARAMIGGRLDENVQRKLVRFFLVNMHPRESQN